MPPPVVKGQGDLLIYSSMRPVGDVYPDYATLGELELDGGNDAIWPKTPDAPMLGGGGRAAGAAAGGGAPYREMPSASSLRQRTLSEQGSSLLNGERRTTLPPNPQHQLPPLLRQIPVLSGEVAETSSGMREQGCAS